MKRKPTTTTAPALEMTASRFAAMMACDRHELAKKLAELKAEPAGTRNGGKLYKLRHLVQAYAGGDDRAERLRKCRAESERIELQNMRTRGELVEVASVKKLGERVMIAIRNTILNMPLTDDEKDKCLRELMNLQSLDWTREA